ncbi:MAG: molybdopterin-dependent oxidoreductase [Candidatus Omnitrophica bacterium]|nr:molybdopterin-dependent oxidoreductase [Candidatus Omnitrophota bacterium]
MPKLTIDGKEVDVPRGTTIIQAADKMGISVPRYCYHPALPVSGNCRICLVEVEKQPKLQIACHTKIAKGMVVKTNSPKVLEARKSVLEFLLVNHPLDCPVCDQAGECKLQDYYMEHGQYNSRLVDVKVKKEKKAFSIGPTVMLDQERCILCTRCVRFTDNITKTNEFGVFQRGDHSQLDVYPGKQLDNKYSGNVVDICPVGALTDKDFRFKCRVWYLEKTKSVCPGCSMGCNITVEWDKARPHQNKDGRVMRLKPRVNTDVNDHWMCDNGRYDYHFIDENRILSPQIKDKVVSWNEAIDVVAKAVQSLKDNGRIDRIGILASAKLTNEDLFSIRKLFKDNLHVSQIDFRVPQKFRDRDNFLIRTDKNPNTAGAVAVLELIDPPGFLAGQGVADTQAMIQKARQGDIDFLYVFGHDLVEIYGKDTVEDIAKNVKLFVFQGSNINDTAGYAHVILPSSVYAEKDGTFVNCQHRAQRIWQAFPPLGEAKADWQIMDLLSDALGTPLAYKNSQEIFKDIGRTISSFSDVSYEKIGDQGIVLKDKNVCLIS